MAYERLDEALRQLKTDREREEATEKQQKRESEEAKMRFAQIKPAVIGPIFNEIRSPRSGNHIRITRKRRKRDARDPSGLAAGGKWIRTLGSPREGLGFAPTLVIREVVLPGIL
jgi:hypothetical protein